jgi:polyphosphate kinase 2 (PPK2 family)
MPAYGQFRVYDRSWWEEVLVVPVMKLKPKDVWQKAYALNRTMEWIFMQEGGIVVNLWFDITKAEQKRRFKARAEEKPWKLSPSDAEARKKWKQYTRAANEMFFRGRSWYVVSSEDKRYSRVHVLKIINERIEAALGCPATDSKNAPKLVKKGDKHAKRNK